MLALYARTLDRALRHPRCTMLLVTLGCAVGTVVLYREVPKGFLPTQDTGLIQGNTVADPSTSFAAMEAKQKRVVDVLLADPAVATVGSTVGVTSGWASLNRGQVTVQLKPLAERGDQQRAGDRPAAAQADRHGGRADLPLLRAGSARRRAAAAAAASSSSCCSTRTWPSCGNGRLRLENGAAVMCPASPT